MSDLLAIEATKVALLRARLLELYPELGEDAQALADTLEGMTDFNDMVCAVIDSAENDASMVRALENRVNDMNCRMTRLMDREDRKRRAVGQAMEAAGVRKIEAPEFTISLRALPPKVLVTDETRIPSEFWEEKTVKTLNKTLLKEALETDTVPGAELSNGGASLTIRTK